MTTDDNVVHMPESGGNGGDPRADPYVDEATSFEDLEGEQGVMFPHGSLDGDPNVTMQNIIRTGLPTLITVKMRGAEVPLEGGLLDPEEMVRLFVTAEFFSMKPVPVRDKHTREITEWKIAVELRPTFVQRAEAAVADPATALAG